MKGFVHSIETFGTVDGDGIRFVLFLAGCKLGCKFCHNPDSWNIAAGEPMSAEEVIAQVQSYRAYYEATGGGLTISGGDPLVQPEFTAEILRQAKSAGINTCLETSGHGDSDKFGKLVQLADSVMYGLKGFSTEVYRKLTAHDGSLVRRNLKLLGRSKSQARLRYLVIPGVTDTDEELTQLSHFLRDLPCDFVVEPIAYHTMGIPKWEALGRPYQLEDLRPPTSEEMEQFILSLRGHGLKVLGDSPSAGTRRSA